MVLTALTKDQLKDSDGRLDIYAFMRSAEIREYMRANKEFILEDKIHIIIKSMNPYAIKLTALDLLEAEALTEEEKHLVSNVKELVGLALNEIYNPGEKTIFSITECFTEDQELNAYEASESQSNQNDYFQTLEEFIACYGDFELGRAECLPRYELDLVYCGKPNGSNNPISFSMTFFEDKLEIYDISMTREWIAEKGFDKDISEYFHCGWMHRYSLPFKHLSKVQIMTPFMTKPLTGTISSSLDGLGAWYHFFYADDTRGMACDCYDMSYHTINLTGEFSIFDWMTSADGVPTAKSVSNIEGDYRPLCQIKNLEEGQYSDVIAKVTKLIEVSHYTEYGCRVLVELQDNSGCINAAINMNATDINWIKNVVEAGGFIRTGIEVNYKDGKLMDAETGDTKYIGQNAKDLVARCTAVIESANQVKCTAKEARCTGMLYKIAKGVEEL